MLILVILKQSHDSSPISCASQKESQIFPPTTGGAEVMCQNLKIPLLGKVPLDPRIGGRVQTLNASIPSSSGASRLSPDLRAEGHLGWSGRCQGAGQVLGKEQSGPWETALGPVPPRPSPATLDSAASAAASTTFPRERPLRQPPLRAPSLALARVSVSHRAVH